MGKSSYRLERFAKTLFNLSYSTFTPHRVFMAKYYPQLVIEDSSPARYQFGKLQFLSSLVGVFGTYN